MGTKHTPGPWRILPEEVHKNYIRIRGTVFGTMYKIANVPCSEPTGDPKLDENNLAEVRANAVLVSAAPELLGALLLAVKDEPNACFADYAREVIAKAKGETEA